MSPTIKPNEVVSADMSAYHKVGPQRWDVVVFHPPAATMAQQQFWVMRVVGLPNEEISIRNDGIYINGKYESQPDHLANIQYMESASNAPKSPVTYPYKVPANSYFLLGDNTTNSFDSRYWEALSSQNILGKVKAK